MSFGELITKAARGERPGKGDAAELDRTVESYPWFMTARILRHVAAVGNDAMLRLHLQEWPCPGIIIDRIDAPREKDAIDRFLERGDYRIVPQQGGTEENAAAESEKFDAADGLMTEELAEIYLSQGLRSEARKIYEQLSLQNPEKSVYFAELIARCDGD